jgi:peptide/nickel transport system ATP-binding protein
MPSAVLSIRDVVQRYSTSQFFRDGRHFMDAVCEVSLDIFPGQCLGLIGDSASGKSSLARAIVQQPRPLSGSVRFLDQELTLLHGARLRAARRGIQMIYQDPFGSLDPKWTVSAIVGEAASVVGSSARRKRESMIREVLHKVGLEPDIFSERRAGELSGGQCQRVAIARAVVGSPALLICDEAVSSLDPTIQLQILTLLRELLSNHSIACLFISHDIELVSNFCDTVAVLHAGKVCEIASADEIFSRPTHPETARLVAAARAMRIPSELTRMSQLRSAEIRSDISPHGREYHSSS